MKMTKVIREYMEETLSAKRLEANKKSRADYDARRKACIEELKALREKNGYNYEIEMDGGINEATSKLAAASGADILVSGNAVFKADDPKVMIAKMHLAKK